MTARSQGAAGLSWGGIVRLGLVMFALGSVVILTTSVFNRVINYEYGLPMLVAGFLVGWREALQFMRPRWGYGSDRGGRRTPWILSGMALLCAGGALGAFATVLMDNTSTAIFHGPLAGPAPGIVVAFFAYTLIGLGTGAAGTCLLALLATTVAPARRPISAALVWILMIVGFVVTTNVGSNFLGVPDKHGRAPSGEVEMVMESPPDSAAVAIEQAIVPNDDATTTPDESFADTTGAEAAATPNVKTPKPPFSPIRLLVVCLVICACSFVLAVAALWGLERKNPPIAVDGGPETAHAKAAESASFWQALKLVCSEPRTLRFGVFVLVAMLAFELQSLIMEPFGAEAYGLDIAQTTKLASYQHAGVAVGMILVGALGSLLRGTLLGSFRFWAIAGCLLSAVAHVGMVCAGAYAPDWPLAPSLVFLGFSNGMFAVAAIGSMMLFASEGGHGSEGTRMGVWGTAQAVAMGAGAVLGTAVADVGTLITGDKVLSFQSVFALEAILFVSAALLALRIGRFGAAQPTYPSHSASSSGGSSI